MHSFTLTRPSKTLSGMLEQIPIDEITLTDAIEQFDIRWNNLLTAQEQLERFIDPEQLDKHIEDIFLFDNMHRRVRVLATSKLRSLNDSAASGVNQDSVSSVSAREQFCSLPKLELATFDGNVTEW